MLKPSHEEFSPFSPIFFMLWDRFSQEEQSAPGIGAVPMLHGMGWCGG